MEYDPGISPGNKEQKKRIMKKNVRNIVIGVCVALVIIAVVVVSILLRPDTNGLNAFDRSKVVAKAGGQSITLGEYHMALNNAMSYYSYYGITYNLTQEEKDDIIDGLLINKLYVAKMRELGLDLTAEQKAEARKTAQEQLSSLEESIGEQLATSGSFSSAALQTRINDYFTRQLGMSKSQYVSYIENQQIAAYAAEIVREHYAADIENYTEDDLLAYYRETASEGMDNYSLGSYASNMQMYSLGYMSVPALYVPEGFLYTDVVRIADATDAELNELNDKLQSGELTFEEMIEDPRNTAPMHVAANPVPGPYAIGEGDFAYVSAYADLYKTVADMNVGDIRLAVDSTTSTAEDGTETTSNVGYFLRRVDGTFCENGAASGVVSIDYYEGVRDTIENAYRNSRFEDITDSWLTDRWVDATVYAA